MITPIFPRIDERCWGWKIDTGSTSKQVSFLRDVNIIAEI